MKTYNLLIEDEKEWENFKKKYKKAKLGRNINESIMKLIKEFNGVKKDESK